MEIKTRSCFLSLDLEKTFGGVPQEVNCFVFRQKGISEYLLNVNASDL